MEIYYRDGVKIVSDKVLDLIGKDVTRVVFKERAVLIDPVRPISAFDGRRTKVKQGKRIAKMVGRLIILMVSLGYVIGTTISLNNTKPQAFSPQQSLNVSPEVYQSFEKSSESSPTQVPSTPAPTTTKQNTTTSIKNPKNVYPTRKGITRFVKAYNGSRINETYLNQLYKQCGDDSAKVARVVGIALAETGLGRDTKKVTNFYGWYPNRNRGYDPSLAEMAKVMCKAVSGPYKDIGKNVKVTSTYTGSDGTAKWIERFNWAIKRMGVE